MLSDGILAADFVWGLLPLVITALLNAAHAAAIYLDDAALRRLTETGDRRARRITALLKPAARTEQAVLLADALALILSGSAVLRVISRYMPSELLTLGRLGGVLLFGVLFVALGVAAPRRLAGYFPQPFAYSLSGFLRFFSILLFFPAVLIDIISSLAVRLSGSDPNHEPHGVTEEEIRMLVDEGNQRGSIEQLEREMINNIFEFDDRDVTEVMTHRTEVAALPNTATLDEAASLFLSTGYSRIPVYEENIDSIIGILYAKDLLRYLRTPQEFLLTDIMRRPLYVPESCSCSDALSLFRLEKTQFAVVVDEYGGTYGIVTMEDLLEAIVGNIQDEYDNEIDQATLISEGVYLLDGSVGISEAERLLSFKMPGSFDAETLGGFVTELLGGVPGAGAQRSITFDRVTLTVLQADERRITKLRAVVKPAQKPI